jgi:hypothetical protein
MKIKTAAVLPRADKNRALFSLPFQTSIQVIALRMEKFISELDLHSRSNV